ncbi:hypothetical protein C5Z26_07970 [Lactobacillus sp. CBA3606]|uniref:hypothetical protein n=1 Tax=Lactobacillus sp. CBA3606 TaxID=2099789 RepID=UPI000CFD2D4E|nr:hypothetical protein [Lactobacillus sp. CBA3606]AVK64051.1 hypothetical protein C5Z26_07970 [Lactobacillus sp. CBA3606]
MTVIKKRVQIELPANSIYHVITNDRQMKIIIKCDDSSIYAPVAGRVIGYSKQNRTIDIITENSEVSLRMQLPAGVTEQITFYINLGERVTRGLKLADLKALSGDLSITTVNLDEHYHYEICKR